MHSDPSERHAASASDPASLQRQLRAMREEGLRSGAPEWPQRRRRLLELRRLLQDSSAELCRAIDADFGCRCETETRLLELVPALQGIDHALRHGRRWMRTRRRPAGRLFLPASTSLTPRPLGVVGVIVPWNYPLYLAAGPITDALVAGNRVMVKMSEFTPRFSALFAERVAARFAAEVLTVVNGDAEVARSFSALPFDHLLFTGSTAVGHAVMRAASEHLTPVTLELGGKSPAIIGPGARFEHAVERIMYGKCVNAGQTCIAPDYVLLPRGREQDFIELARRTFARWYPGFADNRDYTSIISAARFERLVALREQALRQGARVWPLAEGTGSLPRRMAPTVLTDVPESAAVMREEIFGPLLPLLPYDTLDQALAQVASRPHPLALYLFEDDRNVQARVLARCQAGGVTLNDTLFHIAQHHLPFGGVGASGMGAYHGEAGFLSFSKQLPVLHQARLNAAGWLSPPYGRRLLGALMRMLSGR